jgi:flagellar export protein FliJ
MSSRLARIERIIRLRQQHLDEELKLLAEARTGELSLARELADRTATYESARSARRSMAGAAQTARSFDEAGDWLCSQEALVDLAQRRLAQSRRQVGRCQQRVLAARRKVEELELLQGRLESVREQKLAREERALEDEIAQRVAKSDRGRG